MQDRPGLQPASVCSNITCGQPQGKQKGEHDSNHQTIRIYITIIIPMKTEEEGPRQPLLNSSSASKKSILSERSNPQQSYNTHDSLGFAAQSRLLIYKNVVLTFRNPKNLFFLIITPFLLSLFLFVFQNLARDSGQRTKISTPVLPLDGFQKCYGEDCVSLHYRLISQFPQTKVPAWVDYSINYIKLQTGFGSNDVTTGTNIVTYDDLEAYYSNSKINKNKTQIALFFCTGHSDDIFLQMFYCNGTKDYTYFLVLNKSDSLSVIFHDYLEPLPIDTVAANLKLLVDNAILSYIKNPHIQNRVKEIYYSHTQFPVGENKYIDNYDIVTTIGAFYYLITPLFAFLFIQNEIVREKEYKLRQGLNIFGATHFAYWTSWFVVSNIYALIVSVSTYLAGLAFGFGFFRETPFYIVIFFMMYPFTLAMQMLAYFISALAPTLKASNTVSYGIMLFAIVIQSFVSDNMLLTFLFTQDASNIVIFLRYFFCCYPPFSYTKIFTNIAQYSGYHFSFTERRWVGSEIPYDLGKFAENIQAMLPFGGGNYYRYSDLISMLILYGDCIFFLILTWYFDHVIASNRGRSQPFYFPIKRIVNLFKKAEVKQRTFLENEEYSPFSLQDEEESARKERLKVQNNSKNNVPALGMRVKNLCKTFKSLFSSHKVQALKNFTLQIQANELMGILGHNGAGKTTLINILTGVITPDEMEGSEIIIDNHSISDINEIRKHIGVCSQFDILWNELTAEQHLYMFARLKGIPEGEVDGRIDQVLTFVSLLPEKKNKAGSFSGGMKRRLSLAIAAIGNPKIILLDEPTTGLDPKVRNQVWHLIQKLKVGKSIILTTHSMQQADVLADRICVVVKGRMKCVGTPFYLKKLYGEGHRLTINLKNRQNWQEVVGRIQRMFPNVRVVDCRGGSLIIGITEYHDLIQLVRKLESKESHGLDEYELKNAIKAWAVSHSTLEEVFMKVSREKEE